MRKTSSLIIVALSLASCATRVKNDVPWAKKLIGKEGYFTVRPSSMDFLKAGTYSPCEKIKILGFQSIGGGWIIANLEQQGNLFNVSTKLDDTNQSVPLFEEQFVNKLNLSNKKEKFSSGTFSRKELICKGSVFVSMTKEEFLVGHSLPEKNNRTTGNFGVHEQWVYGSLSDAQYYYFEDGILKSWQD